MKTFFAFTIILLCRLFTVFSPTLHAQTHHDWTYDKVVYEVNIRQYTPEGTFTAFETHLDRLQELGVGILWLMPIHPIGEVNRLGSLGSYYSVRDYYSINPEFGDSTSFSQIVQAIHDRGMYVMMDWVANHTSWDNVLTQTHPDWYVKDGQGNFTPPPGTNWSDVIQLDHSQPELLQYMIEAQKYWVTTFGIDGFRYDAVSWVPHAFWQASNDSLKAFKSDLFLLAEGNGEEWHQSGFDMSFGWDFYGFERGILIDLVQENANATNLTAYFRNQIQLYPVDDYRLYFTSNHDENSWHGTPLELFGATASAFAVLSATVHSVSLIYSGQEAGLNKRLAFFDKDVIPWRIHDNFELYQTLIRLKKENSALYNGTLGGEFTPLQTNNTEGVFSFKRQNGEDKIVGVVNVTNTEQSVRLSGESIHGRYIEVFSKEVSTFEDDTTLTLSPWHYRIYSSSDVFVNAEHRPIPQEITLFQNYPNPFNPNTTISFEIPRSMHIKISIYSVSGTLISNLANQTYPQGIHKYRWDASNFSSGIYFIHLETSQKRIVKKMLLLK